MKIERNDIRITLKDVCCGECFEYNGNIYIKLNVLIHDELSGGYDTCIDLSNGNPVALGFATDVIPVNAKVVIE